MRVSADLNYIPLSICIFLCVWLKLNWFPSFVYCIMCSFLFPRAMLCFPGGTSKTFNADLFRTMIVLLVFPKGSLYHF